MGSSLPPPATLDLVGSIARRHGSAIEVLLARAEVPSDSGELMLTLSHSGQVVRVPAQTRPSTGGDGSAGTDVLARVPERDLSDGTWKLELARDSGEPTPVTARLLVQGRRPVVLLWGRTAGKSRVPAPRPTATLAGRIAVGGSKALDLGLRPLPAAQATKIRRTARNLAKSVLR